MLKRSTFRKLHVFSQALQLITVAQNITVHDYIWLIETENLGSLLELVQYVKLQQLHETLLHSDDRVDGAFGFRTVNLGSVFLSNDS